MKEISIHHLEKDHFENFFSLTFIDEDLQKKYDELNYNNFKPKLIFIILIVLIHLASFSIFIIYKDIHVFPLGFQILNCICVFIDIFTIIILVLTTRFSHLFQLSQYLNLIDFSLLVFIALDLPSYFLTAEHVIDYKYFMLIIDIIVKFTYLLVIDSSFVRVFIINILYVVLVWVIKLIQGATNEITFYGACTFSNIAVIGICYYIERNSKILFYYKEKLKSDNDIYLNILNHMQNGIILYNETDQNYRLLNDFILSYDELKIVDKNEDTIDNNNERISIKNVDNSVLTIDDLALANNNNELNNVNDQDPSSCGSKKNLYLELKPVADKEVNKTHKTNFNIFNKLIDINKELPEEIRKALHSKKFKEIIELINKNYFDVDSELKYTEENSIYFGLVMLNKNNSDFIFEFYLRRINCNKKDYFEIMLNNVTYTKNMEEEKMRQKSLILAKISHEFKNPLIVILESVDKTREIIEAQSFSKSVFNEYEDKDDLYDPNIPEDFANIKETIIENKFNFMQNLCQYMIILVKDFEVVSSIDNNTDLIINLQYFDLKQLMDDTGQIIRTLVKKKAYKPDILTFKLSIDPDIQFLWSDPLRLKQVLINLLSNSVKFTETGVIELKVEKVGECKKKTAGNNNDSQDEESSVDEEPCRLTKFSVIDSGKGISEEMQKVLFKSVIKENSVNNALGAGYGLGIVDNLCNLLGSKINYEPNPTGGSIFSFIIYPNDNKETDHNINEIIEQNHEIEEYEESTQLEQLEHVGKKVDIIEYNDVYASNSINKPLYQKKLSKFFKEVEDNNSISEHSERADESCLEIKRHSSLSLRDDNNISGHDYNINDCNNVIIDIPNENMNYYIDDELFVNNIMETEKKIFNCDIPDQLFKHYKSDEKIFFGDSPVSERLVFQDKLATSSGEENNKESIENKAKIKKLKKLDNKIYNKDTINYQDNNNDNNNNSSENKNNFNRINRFKKPEPNSTKNHINSLIKNYIEEKNENFVSESNVKESTIKSEKIIRNNHIDEVEITNNNSITDYNFEEICNVDKILKPQKTKSFIITPKKRVSFSTGFKDKEQKDKQRNSITK